MGLGMGLHKVLPLNYWMEQRYSRSTYLCHKKLIFFTYSLRLIFLCLELVSWCWNVHSVEAKSWWKQVKQSWYVTKSGPLQSQCKATRSCIQKQISTRGKWYPRNKQTPFVDPEASSLNIPTNTGQGVHRGFGRPSSTTQVLSSNVRSSIDRCKLVHSRSIQRLQNSLLVIGVGGAAQAQGFCDALLLSPDLQEQFHLWLMF